MAATAAGVRARVRYILTEAATQPRAREVGDRRGGATKAGRHADGRS